MPRKRVVFEEPSVETPGPTAVVEPDPQDADGEARAQRAIDIVLKDAFRPIFDQRTMGGAQPISALNRTRQ